MSLTAQNNSLAQPRNEERPIPIHFIILASGEAGIEQIDEFTLAITPLQIASIVYAVIPNWLKDSRSPIPMNEDIDVSEARGKAQLLETGRIGMKSFIAATGMLSSMVKDLYGPDADVKPRADSLPVVSQWMSWFVAAQVAKSPIEIVVENGYIRDIRQSINVSVQENNASASLDHSERAAD